MIDFRIVIGFRGILCAQFNPIMHHFLRYSDVLCFIFRYTQACNFVYTNIDLFCGLVLIFLCGLISLSGDTNQFIIASDKGQFIFVCIKIVFSFNTSVVTTVWAGQNFKWSII